MARELEEWAVAERQFIREDIKWFNAGARLKSPSGDDITQMKIEQLEKRLEHVNQALDALAKGT